MSSLEYHRDYNSRRYQRLRAAAISAMGGVCVDCGSDDRLEFDHVDPEKKEFNVSPFLTQDPQMVNEELKKCVLRCNPCHTRRSAEQKSVEHGAGISGKRNCKCVACKERKAEYMREWKRKRRMGMGPSGKGAALSAQ